MSGNPKLYAKYQLLRKQYRETNVWNTSLFDDVEVEELEIDNCFFCTCFGWCNMLMFVCAGVGGSSEWPELVEYFIDRGCDVNRRNPRGVVPLQRAMFPSVFKLLLDAGANPNVDNCFGNQPLVGICNRRWCGGDWRSLNRSECFECAELLVKYGADLDARDQSGRTAMDCALEDENHELVYFLQTWPGTGASIKSANKH